MTEHNTIFDQCEVAIIGGGPIGVEMAITLERLGVDYILFEAAQVGDAFMKWPPETHFFSTPEHVALAGIPVHNLDQRSITGEQYLAYLRTLVETFDLNLHNYEPVEAIRPYPERFLVQTEHRTGPRTYACRYVIVATGGMAGPRLLHIPGEELPHVTHYFPGPHPYFRTRLLIVGGRNSAVEAALRCWRAGAASIAISHRRPTFNFDRIKPHLSGDLKDRLEKGEITYYPSTVPVEITPGYVTLASTEDGRTPNGAKFQHEVDFVYLATGFEADMSLFENAGVELVGLGGAPVFDPETMETNVPGLFVAGTAAGGTQQRFTYFISTSHDHVAKITKAITGIVPTKLGTIPSRNNAVTWEEIKAN
ncbi:MAG TPA: pyridine nucleotide-disulfide oxidoreductase [Anaerolineae bacterium]|nr:pyridine nucleotide-disulfide oxidoreductase [Anaerolineae bacterium]